MKSESTSISDEKGREIHMDSRGFKYLVEHGELLSYRTFWIDGDTGNMPEIQQFKTIMGDAGF